MSKKRHLSVAASGGNNTNYNPKRDRIQKWMMAVGWQIGEAQAENAEWVIGAVNPDGQPVVIVQPMRSDMIIIQADIAFDENIRKQFSMLTEAERLSVLWDIRLGLLGLGVEFNGVDEPLQRIFISQQIFDDGLTKDAFHHRIQQVRHASIFVIWSLQRRIGRPPQDGWADNLSIN